MNRRGMILAVLALVLAGVTYYSSRAPRSAFASPAHPTSYEPSAQPTSPTVAPLAAATESASAAPNPASAPAPQAAASLSDIDLHKTFGSKSAPVAMEVFSDFQCPACKTLYTSTNRQLIDNYVTTGKVYLIHRDFPLPMHQYSKLAANYARAAAEIGKNELVEQVLFQNQEKWEANGDIDGTLASVLSPAEMVKVRALVKGGTLQPLIDKDIALGRQYNVNQTPTTIFHAKGQTYPVGGVMSYDVMKGFIDQLAGQ